MYCGFLIRLVLLLLAAYEPPTVAEVDEGHSEWDYVLCMQYEGGKNVFPIGVQYTAEIVEYACVETYLYSVAQSKDLNSVQTAWLEQLYDKFRDEENRAVNGQLTIRERKEYRMLTVSELDMFHRALLEFKNDRAEKYDALTSLHLGNTSRAAHHGPAYLVWNRIFLDLFELALREYESDVTLPYWDVTLDSQLEWPTQSKIWSPQYAGNGDGLVNTGPFANWDIEGRKLMRNVGHSGRLMKPDDVTRIMTGSMSISDITFPNAEFANNLELHSYGVRLWIGGDMALLQTSMNDPMYFLLNAYIDSVWQDFRDLQVQNNMDPEKDWPVRFSGYTAHFPNQELGVVPGTRNIAGLRDGYGKQMYRYIKPSCSPQNTCGTTGALACNVITRTCEAVANGQGGSCLGNSGYQNSYCLDENNCDERDWVYLPIQVSYIRPDEFIYPVNAFTSPSTRTANDIYSAIPFSNGAYNTSLRNKKDFPVPKFDTCKCSRSETGRVYIQTYGLNYNGTYREYSTIDKRLPISSAWTYAAVKDPRDSPDFQSRALIRVYDECGNICVSHCRVTGSDEYNTCSGVVIVSTKEPKQYSDTMENVFYMNWDYFDQTPYPSHKRDLSFLKFYCDYSAIWPWLNFGYIEDPYKPRPPPPVDPDIEDLQTTTTTTTTTTTKAPTTTTTTTEPTTTVLIKSEWCFNATQCFENYEPTNCTRCEHHTFSFCWDHCGKYLHCNKGVWHVKDCAAGLLWDDRVFVKTCNYAYNIPCRPRSRCDGCNSRLRPFR